MISTVKNIQVYKIIQKSEIKTFLSFRKLKLKHKKTNNDDSNYLKTRKRKLENN